jgi:hypothetical protein
MRHDNDGAAASANARDIEGAITVPAPPNSGREFAREH